MEKTENKGITIFGLLVLIGFVVFFIPRFLRLNFLSDKSLFLLLIGWLFCIVVNRLSSKISIFLGMVFLVISSFFVYYQKEAFSQETGVLAFIFLAIGIFQQFISLLKEKN